MTPVAEIIVNALFWGVAGGVLYRLRGWGYWDRNVLEGRATWAIGTGLAFMALTGSPAATFAGFVFGWIGLMRGHGRWFKMKNPVTDVPMMALIGTYQSAWLALTMAFYDYPAALFILACGPLMGISYWIGSKIPTAMLKGPETVQSEAYILYSEVIAGFQLMACLYLSRSFTELL